MKRLKHLEIGLAVFVSALAIALHWHCATRMGPLWRDEVNCVSIDSMPTFKDVWDHLQYDSFPLLWHCTLRAWLKLGLSSDDDLRLFGFLIGTATIIALWINARIFKHTSPLLALVLLELNPTIIRWGGSVRGYGLGLLLSISILGAVWFLLKKPSAKSFLIALGLCLLAVHSLFYSAVLVFAAGVAGMTWGCVCRQYKGVALIAGLGALCALSLLLYAPSIKQAGAWNMLVHAPDFNFFFFLGKLFQALGSLWGFLDVGVWAGLVLAAVITTVLFGWQRDPKNPTVQHAGMFFLIGLLVCFPGYFLFLDHLGYPTQPWYYISFMGFCALAVEGMLASHQKAFAIARLALGLVLVYLWFPWAWADVGERMTNIDLVAEKIEVNRAKRRSDRDQSLVSEHFFSTLLPGRYPVDDSSGYSFH